MIIKACLNQPKYCRQNSGCMTALQSSHVYPKLQSVQIISIQYNHRRKVKRPRYIFSFYNLGYWNLGRSASFQQQNDPCMPFVLSLCSRLRRIHLPSVEGACILFITTVKKLIFLLKLPIYLVYLCKFILDSNKMQYRC